MSGGSPAYTIAAVFDDVKAETLEAAGEGMRSGLAQEGDIIEARSPYLTGNFRRAIGVDDVIPASTVAIPEIRDRRDYRITIAGNEVSAVFAEGMIYGPPVEARHGVFAAEFGGGAESPGAENVKAHVEAAVVEKMAARR